MEKKFAIRHIVSIVLGLAIIGVIIWTLVSIKQIQGRTNALVAKWNELNESNQASNSTSKKSVGADGKLTSARLMGMRVAEYENDYVQLYEKYRVAKLNHTLNDYDMEKLEGQLAAVEDKYNVYCGENCLKVNEWILADNPDNDDLVWRFYSNYNIVTDTPKTVVWLGYREDVLWGFVTAECDVNRGLFTNMKVYKTLLAGINKYDYDKDYQQTNNLFIKVLTNVVDKYEAQRKAELDAQIKAEEEERLKAEEEERQRQESEQQAAAEQEAENTDYAEDVYSPDTSGLPDGWDDGIIIE